MESATWSGVLFRLVGWFFWGGLKAREGEKQREERERVLGRREKEVLFSFSSSEAGLAGDPGRKIDERSSEAEGLR